MNTREYHVIFAHAGGHILSSNVDRVHTSHAASAKEGCLISEAQNLWTLCNRSYCKNTGHRKRFKIHFCSKNL